MAQRNPPGLSAAHSASRRADRRRLSIGNRTRAASGGHWRRCSMARWGRTRSTECGARPKATGTSGTPDRCRRADRPADPDGTVDPGASRQEGESESRWPWRLACARTARRCMAIKNMGGESERPSELLLHNLVARSLKTPELVSLSSTAVPAWTRRWRRSGPMCRSSVSARAHNRVISSSHAPDGLNEEVSADYNDLIYAQTRQEIEAKRKAFIRKWRLKCRAVADSLEEAGDRLFTLPLPQSQWKSIRTTNAIERLHEEFKAADQDPNCIAECGDRGDALLGIAGFGADRDAQGRWLEEPRREAFPIDY